MALKIFKTQLCYLAIILFSCNTQENSKTSRWLDDIHYDKKIDKKNFLVCDEDKVIQYFNLGDAIDYKGDKPMIINEFIVNYNSTNVKKESGLIKIRFIVNCEGETDRFRMMQSGLIYKEKVFDKNISD